MTKTAVKLDGLTSLRFFAASMIVVQHSMGFLGVPEATAWHFPLHQGVSFFFVLSGFILAFVYRDQWTPGLRMRFFVARFARIYPVHLFTFLLVLVLLPRGAWVLAGTADAPAAIANLLLVQAWIPIWRFYASFNSPSWSISAELLFYLAFPLLIVMRASRALLLCAAIAATIVAFAALAHLPYGASGDAFVTASALLYNHPVARLFEFALGIATHALWTRRAHPGGSVGNATAGEIAALFLIAASIYTSPPLIAALLTHVADDWKVAVGTYLGGTASAIPFAILIYLIATARGHVSRVLRHPIAVRLGEISFAMYMLHGTFFIFYDVHKAAFATYDLALRYAGFWFFLLLSSWLLWQHVEVPFRQGILRRFADRARVPGTPRPRAAGHSSDGLTLTTITGLFFLYLSCIGVVHLIRHPPSNLKRITNDQAESTVPGSLLPGTIVFGDGLDLLSTRIRRDSAQRLFVDLTWKTETDRKLVYRVAVHLLDDQDRIIGQADFSQDVAESTVRSGQRWMDSPLLPASASHATKIGIAVFRQDEFLIAAQGTRDWGNRRLVIPLKKSLGDF